MQELQRRAEGYEGVGSRSPGRIGRRSRVPCRCQRDTSHINCSESHGRVHGRAVLRCIPLAGKLHREELLLPRLRPCLQVMRSAICAVFVARL
jgi:hypothetical protein